MNEYRESNQRATPVIGNAREVDIIAEELCLGSILRGTASASWRSRLDRSHFSGARLLVWDAITGAQAVGAVLCVSDIAARLQGTMTAYLEDVVERGGNLCPLTFTLLVELLDRARNRRVCRQLAESFHRLTGV